MKEKIIKILSDIRPEFDFSQNVDFIKEGMLDSFDIVTLVDAIEEECAVAILGSDILPENFCSIDAIINIIEKSKV
ncbi:acyl carrier protein [Bacteroidaceae bacterium HV4-6-C5C]|nr:acyl carrier protein [Bacteroidaceae bacterium HV4-6-C5C]